MKNYILTNIKELYQTQNTKPSMVKGANMAQIPSIKNAWLQVENGTISDFGSMETLPESTLQKIDCSNKMVLPAWCDSHTHMVFAGQREDEFLDKVRGASYEEIFEKGGGILNSSRKLQATSEDELFETAFPRLAKAQSYGTAALEIKSGYGLSVDAEIKMLRVIRRLKEASNMSIKASFLGAHAIPLEYKNNRSGYIKLICEEMVPQIAAEGLADYIDVFCDKGFFTVEETDTILTAGAKYSLKPKIHANELDYSGGIQVGVKHGAISVDHLEFTGEAEIQSLLNSNTIPTLLPGTAFFLKFDYPPARRIIDAGLPLALASDFNPGSCPSLNVPFVMALSCIYMKMMPIECVNALTINGAYAMEIQNTHGYIAKGLKANLIITKEINSLTTIPYYFGENPIEKTIIDGEY